MGLARLALRSLAAMASPGGRRGRLSILIYHRVLGTDDALNAWDVSAAMFDAQMRVLAEQFSPLPLGEAVDRLQRGSLPARAACVTFDDGYADNESVALPILKQHGVPATFFVSPGYLDGGRMWNDTVVEAVRRLPAAPLDLSAWGLGSVALDSDAARRAALNRLLPALKYLPAAERDARAGELAARAGLRAHSDLMMRASQVRSLHAAGMEIGAHTMTHPILANQPLDVARREIVESGERLADVLRAPVRLFAYPNGKPGRDYGPEHVRIVRDAGFTAAVSTAWGVAGAGADRFQLPRFTPWDRTPGRFALRLIRNAMLRTPQTVPAG